MKKPVQQNQRNWLDDQLRDWVSQKIISPDQAGNILDLYETSEVLAEKRGNFAIFTLIAASCLLFGAGFLLLIGFNWEDMPQAVKLAFIFGLTGGVHAAGFYLSINKGFTYLGESLTFLGCIFYGAGIWLIAQIFNLNAHYPDGFWWWAVGVIPLAFLAKTPLLWVLAVVIEACWVGSEAFGDFNRPWFFFGFHLPIPYATWTFIFLAAPGFLWAYLKQSPVACVLHLGVTFFWFFSLGIQFQETVNPIYFLSAVGAAFWLLGLCHVKQWQIGAGYRALGIMITWGFLTALCFGGVQEEVARISRWERGWAIRNVNFQFFAALLNGLVGIGLFLTAYWRRKNAQTIYREGGPRPGRELFLAMSIMAFFSILPGNLAMRVLFPENPAFIPISTIEANALMLLFTAWLMDEGIYRDIGILFFAGVASFLLWTIQRYIDLFGEMAGMLGAAGLFFLSALALMGMAIFWRRRKGERNVTES